MPTIYGKSKIGKGTYLGPNVVVGHPGREERAILLSGRFDKLEGAVIGDGCTIRDFTIIYNRAKIGNGAQTGHYALVREDATIGEGTLIGTNTVVENLVRIGNCCSIQTAVYIPTNMTIEDDVFVGPRVCFTNDKYMGRTKDPMAGAHVCRGARIGANSTILPGLKLGKECVVGSGSVVTKDVEEYAVVVGNPAKKIGVVPLEHRRY
jgi:acetyltransferase-like isoleucine patch superfamily enzyme